jgi:phosphoenolpyruvate synthase/pyruvate phosphate dikinase
LRSKWIGIRLDEFISANSGNQAGVILKGRGSGAGMVIAEACVIREPEDFNRMKPGTILVAAITTPAWTPLFAIAAAVVTDIGGPLSHSSIVAREHGIPAVLGTGAATRRIRAGQTVTVDGDAGTVVLGAKLNNPV